MSTGNTAGNTTVQSSATQSMAMYMERRNSNGFAV
jgi:hypothetical protein